MNSFASKFSRIFDDLFVEKVLIEILFNYYNNIYHIMSNIILNNKSLKIGYYGNQNEHRHLVYRSHIEFNTMINDMLDKSVRISFDNKWMGQIIFIMKIDLLAIIGINFMCYKSYIERDPRDAFMNLLKIYQIC